MKDELISILESFEYPVFLQGSLGEDEDYPESFFTFWNNSSDGDRFYDNETKRFVWNFDVNFYSVDPALVNSMLEQARTTLKQNGFIVVGKGRDLASDEPTHTGRGYNVIKLELE